eukprot:g46187.t1
MFAPLLSPTFSAREQAAVPCLDTVKDEEDAEEDAEVAEQDDPPTSSSKGKKKSISKGARTYRIQGIPFLVGQGKGKKPSKHLAQDFFMVVGSETGRRFSQEIHVVQHPCGIFLLRDVNPTLRTDIRFALLQRINLWHHQGFITSYAHGNSNAATATSHGNTYPKAKIGIWKKVSLLVNEGQRTGNDIPQPQPDFENGAREHNFPDGVFVFQASTRHGQHAHWCECNGPTCDSRNRTSPPSRPRPFNVSAINPVLGYRLGQAIVDELNYFANCDVNHRGVTGTLHVGTDHRAPAKVPDQCTRDPSNPNDHSFGSVFSAFARCQTTSIAHKGSQQPRQSFIWLRVFGGVLQLQEGSAREQKKFSPLSPLSARPSGEKKKKKKDGRAEGRGAKRARMNKQKRYAGRAVGGVLQLQGVL